MISITTTEDDLRPHLRKPKKSKKNSSIDELAEKYENREALKIETLKKIEKEKNEKRAAEISNEIAQISENDGGFGRSSDKIIKTPSINKHRRYNDLRYFNWSPRELETIVTVPIPSIQNGSINDCCELCTLAHQHPMKSDACVQVDQFLKQNR